MEKRYKTQSIAVNDEEVSALKDWAKKARMKPAALARALFYRGVADFLEDGQIHADETDDELFQRLKDVFPGIPMRPGTQEDVVTPLKPQRMQRIGPIGGGLANDETQPKKRAR